MRIVIKHFLLHNIMQLEVTLRKSGWRTLTCWGFFLWRNLVTTTVAITIATQEGHWKLVNQLCAFKCLLVYEYIGLSFAHKLLTQPFFLLRFSKAYVHHALKIKSKCSLLRTSRFSPRKNTSKALQTHFLPVP
jgi:hypothetical protein